MTTWKFHISDHIILYAKYEISILNLVNIIKGFNNFVSQRGNLIFELDKKNYLKYEISNWVNLVADQKN